jgi:hypothetical protein
MNAKDKKQEFFFLKHIVRVVKWSLQKSVLGEMRSIGVAFATMNRT